MRILFTSTTLPKKAAKRLLNFRSLADTQLTLGVAQEITAYMLGYSSWSELHEFTANNKSVSELDEEVSAHEREARYDYQELRLADHAQYFPDDPMALHSIVRLVEVSARTPANERLPEYSAGSFAFPKRGFAIYQASLSEDVFCLEIDEFWVLMGDGVLPDEVSDRLLDFTYRFPNNVNAISLLLNNFHRQQRTHPRSNAICNIEDRIQQLCNSLIEHGIKKLSWDQQDNRDFLRVCFQLYEHFSLTNNTSKSLEWRQRLMSLTSVFNHEFA